MIHRVAFIFSLITVMPLWSAEPPHHARIRRRHQQYDVIQQKRAASRDECLHDLRGRFYVLIQQNPVNTKMVNEVIGEYETTRDKKVPLERNIVILMNQRLKQVVAEQQEAREAAIKRFEEQQQALVAREKAEVEALAQQKRKRSQSF